MKNKRLLSLILIFALLFASVMPAFAAPTPTAPTAAAETTARGEVFLSFFQNIFSRLRSFFLRIRYFLQIRIERVPNTMHKNVIHMLKSVTDTIGDSFIITTEDGKVIVIDGGHRTETPYFIEYLRAVTGQRKPHIDAWFLSHAHDDHCEVFLEIVGKHADEVSFDKVYANFPEPSFYEGEDSWAVDVLTEYGQLLPAFADKAAALREGDVFNIGAAKFTVFYTFNPAWKNCNEGSTIMRMDLGDSSVMFTGDAGIKAGNYVVEKYGGSGLLHCDYCKMAHHGQNGVDRNFYEAVAPRDCLWPTPTWVWDNVNGNLQTLEVRAWMDELGVQKNYLAWEGSQRISMDRT